MTPAPSVLIGLAPTQTDLRSRLVGWVREMGYEPSVAADGPQAVAWAHQRVFAASLLACGVEAAAGVEVWRSVHPVLGRRLVLMVRDPRRDLWFEALEEGVGAVLPIPPEQPMVREALRVATAPRPRFVDRPIRRPI